MKQFIYLDTDIVSSIIAQAEKGYITQETIETGIEKEQTKEKKAAAELGASGGLKLFKLVNGEVRASLSGELQSSTTTQATTREIAEKILHDATFDIAYGYIEPCKAPFGNQDNDEEGSYLEIKRVFDFVDFDYLEGLFVKDGVIDLIKKNSTEQLEESANTLKAGYDREQLKRVGSKIKQELKKAIDLSNKQYDDVAAIIKAIRSLIPYSRMLISRDGYLVPLDDKYFRIDPACLGFKYGGEMTCVGMVTNIIGESTDPSDEKNIFATIQFTANEALRKLLPTPEQNLCVIHPIAVYYGS